MTTGEFGARSAEMDAPQHLWAALPGSNAAAAAGAAQVHGPLPQLEPLPWPLAVAASGLGYPNDHG